MNAWPSHLVLRVDSRWWLSTRLLGGLFCALVVASALAQSADPLDAWQLRYPLPGISLNAVSFGNGLWVGVGFAGMIATSSDTTNWTVRSSGTEFNLSGGDAVLAWPSDSIGFVLESTADPAAPRDWTPVNKTPAIANSQNIVTVAPPARPDSID